MIKASIILDNKIWKKDIKNSTLALVLNNDAGINGISLPSSPHKTFKSKFSSSFSISEIVSSKNTSVLR